MVPYTIIKKSDDPELVYVQGEIQETYGDYEPDRTERIRSPNEIREEERKKREFWESATFQEVNMEEKDDAGCPVTSERTIKKNKDGVIWFRRASLSEVTDLSNRGQKGVVL